MEYKYMQGAVDILCKDMEDNPSTYSIGTYTFSKKGSGVEYWLPLGDREPITEVWDGCTHITVFSLEQGYKIRKAFDKLRDTIASEEQNRVILSTQPTTVEQSTEVEEKEDKYGSSLNKGLYILFGVSLFSATIWSLL